MKFRGLGESRGLAQGLYRQVYTGIYCVQTGIYWYILWTDWYILVYNKYILRYTVIRCVVFVPIWIP